MFSKYISYLLLALVVISSMPLPSLAMGHASDTLSLSWPGSPANHTIRFYTAHDLPPGGKIIITPAAGEFAVFSDFDYTDVDLATSSNSTGTYIERELAATSSPTADGVEAIASSPNDQITITINSSYGIPAGTWVKIKLGTNAIHGAGGDQQIINPAAIGSYGIDVIALDQSDGYIERAELMVAIVQPVLITAKQIKIRSNGSPSGYLGFGTTQTIMSLTTNYKAICRYSAIASTSYYDMTDQFAFTGEYYHSIILTGLVNGGHYTYYILCRDDDGVVDDSEFIIDFNVREQSGEHGDDSGQPGGGGAGGGGGGGYGPGQGPGTGEALPYPPLPGNPSVTFQGWAYPSSPVILIKDGKEEKRIVAGVNSDFKIDVYALKQGVYTFGIWAEDAAQRKSVTQSFTFWIKEGTQTQVYEIIIPPTIAANKTNFKAGDMIVLSGQSNSGSQIEAWLYPKKNGPILDKEIVKVSATTDAKGNWQINEPANALSKGTYLVKAKSIRGGKNSEFGNILTIGVDVIVAQDVCSGADLNHDGRVNITDFSILLYWWGTDNACADQNKDGIVNLTDFSIMMFYWTG